MAKRKSDKTRAIRVSFDIHHQCKMIAQAQEISMRQVFENMALKYIEHNKHHLADYYDRLQNKS